MIKKVAFFITCMSLGGAEKVLIDILNGIDKNQYEVTLIIFYKYNIYNKDSKMLELHLDESIKVKYLCDNSHLTIYHTFNRALNRINNQWIYRILIGNKFDTEIAFTEGLPTTFLAHSTNKNSKKIAWFHTDARSRLKYIEQEVIHKEKQLYQRYSEIVAVSRCVAQSFEEVYEIQEPIKVCYNPVDIEIIQRKASEKAYRVVGNSIHLVTVGRMTQIKGYERLIQVLERLSQENLNFTMTFVGDGEIKDKLVEMVKEKKMESYIKFVGFQVNPYPYVKQSDLFICSSYAEGYSTAVLEALILNVPVVTTECAGMQEMFGDKECGKICSNDEEGLYDALRYVLKNPEQIQKYKEVCLQRVQELHLDQTIRKIEKIF